MIEAVLATYTYKAYRVNETEPFYVKEIRAYSMRVAESHAWVYTTSVQGISHATLEFKEVA